MISAEQLVMGDIDLVASSVAKVTDSQGQSYTVVKDPSGYYDYKMHNSIYFTVKVAVADMKVFEQKLMSEWKQHLSK